MLDNPYAKLIKMMRVEGAKNNPTTFLIGTVKTATPFTIDVSQITLSKDDLLINADILTYTVNDKVLLLPSTDFQQFILVCKLI